MATFKTPQAEPIQPEQVVGKTSVDTSTAELISGLGEVAGQAVKEHQKDSLRKDIEDTARVVTTVDELAAQGKEQGLKQAFDPESGEVLVDLERVSPELRKQYDEVIKGAKDKFASISSAKSQGALSETAAALQIEADLNSRIASTPGFAPELRALARDLAGYDPSGFHLRQILDINKPRSTGGKTVEQKWQEQAEAIVKGMRSTGRTVSTESVYQQIAIAAQKEIEVNIATRDLRLGEIDADQWLQAARTGRGVNMVSMMGKIAEQSVEGGISGPQGYKNLMEQVKQEEKNSFFKAFTESGRVLSTDVQNKITAGVDADYEPIMKAITDNDFGKLLDEKWETIVRLDKMYGRQMAPRLAFLTNAFGQQMAGKIVDLMSGIANPSQFELLVSQMPGMKEILKINGDGSQDASLKSLNVIQKVMKGDQLSNSDIQYRPLAEAMVYGRGTDPEIRDRFLQGQSPKRGLAWLSRPGQRALSTEKEQVFMKEQFVQGVDRTIAMIAGKIKDDPTLSLGTQDGKIVMFKTTPKTTLHGGDIELGGRRVMNDADARVLQYFADAANNGWADVYGVDGAELTKNIVKGVRDSAGQLESIEQVSAPSTPPPSIFGEDEPAAKGTVKRDSAKDEEIKSLSEQLDAMKKQLDKLTGGKQ